MNCARRKEHEQKMDELLKEILQELKSLNEKFGARTSKTLPDVLTIDDIMEYLQIGRNSAFAIINDKAFTKIQLGRKKGISKVEFLDWWDKKQRKQKLGIVI